MEIKDYITAQGIGVELGIAETWVHRRVLQHLDYVMIGKRRFYTRESLDRFIATGGLAARMMKRGRPVKTAA